MAALVSPSIESLVPYEGGKPVDELARELGVSGAIKLASNENALGPSPLAVEAMRAHLTEVHRYPDGAAFRLRQKIAAHHDVSMAEVIHGAGSNELLDLVVRTVTLAEHHIVFAEPSFVVYRIAALSHGVSFTAVSLRNLTHDLDAMAAAVTPRTRVLFVANPNNPTGTYVSRQAVERLLREVPPEVIIVMDEAYFEYGDAADYPDSLKLRGLRERLLVMRTFSKVYGLAALRVGYTIGPPELIDYMNRVRAPFNVSTLGQEAAIAALDDVAHVQKSVLHNRAERARLSAELERLGLKVAPSLANFVLVDVGRPARAVYDALLRKGVIVRPFANLPSSLRVTIGLKPENDRFLTALAEVLG
ncbi:MAG TPA: histidinol-phosphate transaminase [Polyangiaceae bacterium]|nr:histidinol-phosphate transaminase [Polyangiaceae bacterium]